jgi:hypothetical protein
MGETQDCTKKIGVVVVPGISDPKPGDALRAFTNSLELNGKKIFTEKDSDIEIHWLPDLKKI